MALSPAGRIRINVTGARGGLNAADAAALNAAVNKADGVAADLDATTATLMARDDELAASVAGKATSDQGAKADTAVQTVAGKSGPDIQITKADVGLSNVDNTSDAGKPISTAQATALAGKATSAQGEKADSAVQPDALATAIATRATAAQGAKADSAVQPSGLAAAIGTRVSIDDFETFSSVLDALFAQVEDRPGDAKELYSTSTVGEPASRPVITVGNIVAADAGLLLRINGGDTDPATGYVDIAPRIAKPIYADRTYAVIYRIARAQNPSDPENNAIETRWQNLRGTDKAGIGDTRLGNILAPMVSDGIETRAFLVGRLGAPGVLDYTIPQAAAYGLPYIRIFGNGQMTDVVSIDIADVTEIIRGIATVGDDVLAEHDARLASEAIFDGRIDEIERYSKPLSGLDGDEYAQSATLLEGSVVEDNAGLLDGKPLKTIGGTVGDVSALTGVADADQSGLIHSHGLTGLGGRTGDPTLLDGEIIADQAGCVATRLGSHGVETGAGHLGVMTPLQGNSVADAAGLIGWHDGVRADVTEVDPSGLISSFSQLGREVHAQSFDPRAPAFSRDEIAHRDLFAKASYSAIRRRIPACEPQAYGYNTKGLYGQSLAAAQQAVPTKTNTPLTNVYMIGQSERPTSPYSLSYDTVGDGTLHPLVATAQILSGDYHQANLSEQAGWDDNKIDDLGESILPGSQAFAQQLALEYRGILTDGSREAVVFNSAVPGTTIAQLSKGASPEYYARNIAAATKAKSISVAATKTSAMTAWYFMQGEFDESSQTPGDTYKAKLLALRENLRSDVEVAIFGQSRRAAWITYQTGGQFTDDALGPQVGMAQVQLSHEQPEWYLAAPAYCVTDKGGHLDSNGSRWLGLYFAKVEHIVTVRREGWRPVEPILAEVRGRTALLTFHVPQPPLQWLAVPVGRTLTSYDMGGFRFSDDTGDLPTYAVEILADCVVAAHFSRDTVGTVSAWYASATTDGSGNLADSDQTLSPFKYEWTSGLDAPAANVPELVGKPYPLNNYSVAFKTPCIDLN